MKYKLQIEKLKQITLKNMDVKKEVFWKYKDGKIEIDLVKFANERYATISFNNDKVIVPDYVIEAMIDIWNENAVKIKKII